MKNIISELPFFLECPKCGKMRMSLSKDRSIVGRTVKVECLECRRERVKKAGWISDCYRCGRTYEVVGVGASIVYCEKCQKKIKEERG